MANDITSANSTAVVKVDELFPAGFPLKHYATDQSITSDEETLAEVRTGVDGKQAGGFTPGPTVVHIALEACSESIPYIDRLIKATKSNRKIYGINMVVSLPSIGKTYTYSDGILITAKTMPDGKKVLDPQNFGISFESVKID